MALEIQILHFNDVYHISDVDLVACFAARLQKLRDEHHGPTWTVFSGDAYSPSLEASALRGDHMVDVLNAMKIDVACFGNHDFDFGEGRLRELADRNNFPWTLSNATRGSEGDHTDKQTSRELYNNFPAPQQRLLAGAKPYVVQVRAGVRIGFFGLAGTDWPSNCQNLPSDSAIMSPAKIARATARHLRLQERCDLVIGVTHMRLSEDLAVSNATLGSHESSETVDLLLGGHDHEVVCRIAGDKNEDATRILQGHSSLDVVSGGVVRDVEGPVRIVKSGTDWRGMSQIRLTAGQQHARGGTFKQRIRLSQMVDLKSLPDYSSLPLDPTVSHILSKVQSQISQIVQRPLCHTRTPLDGRSSVIRTCETNLCNMLADAVRAFYDSDIALVNSGGVRCNRVIEPNTSSAPLCVKDVIDIVPFDNAFVVKRVSGRLIRRALENSVSDARSDGRFLHPSGLSFAADFAAAEGRRVLDVRADARRPSQYAADEEPAVPFGKAFVPLEDQDRYTVAMAAFIAEGFDGYACFVEENCEVVVGAEGAMTDTGMLLQIFGHQQYVSENSGTRAEVTHTDGTDRQVERARRAIVKGHAHDGLPYVEPRKDSRIRLIGLT